MKSIYQGCKRIRHSTIFALCMAAAMLSFSNALLASTEQSNARTNPPTQYTLVFDGVSPEDLSELEAYTVLYSGYISHHWQTRSPSLATMAYVYEGSAALLLHNLQRSFEALRAQVRLNKRGDAHYQFIYTGKAQALPIGVW